MFLLLPLISKGFEIPSVTLITIQFDTKYQSPLNQCHYLPLRNYTMNPISKSNCHNSQIALHGLIIIITLLNCSFLVYTYVRMYLNQYQCNFLVYIYVRMCLNQYQCNFLSNIVGKWLQNSIDGNTANGLHYRMTVK